MAAVNVQLSGAGFANRDASVKLVNSATGQVIERKPFLDGSLLVRDVDPGLWQLTVSHPNLVTPIDQRVIRIFPQVPPTLVPVTISPDLFRDNPIRDIPDADLSPVQQTATDVRDRLRPVLGKSPGEAIRAEDWNVLVAGVSDLATAVLSLTGLVSPKGHDHPEIAEKIGEVQDNLRRFSQAFGNSLVELRREIETEVLRRNVNDVLALGQATEDTRARITDRITALENSLQSDTTVFTQNLTTTGSLLLTEVNSMAVAQGAAGNAFLANASVQKVSAVARQYVDSGTQTSGEAELTTYQKTSAVSGGMKFTTIVRS
jgi:hypothetical protein